MDAVSFFFFEATMDAVSSTFSVLTHGCPCRVNCAGTCTHLGTRRLFLIKEATGIHDNKYPSTPYLLFYLIQQLGTAKVQVLRCFHLCSYGKSYCFLNRGYIWLLKYYKVVRETWFFFKLKKKMIPAYSKVNRSGYKPNRIILRNRESDIEHRGHRWSYNGWEKKT